ncbi:MAG: hypothetical protein LBH19_11120 [Dysgonamonadaceae bacterium]|jgi:hypothetical protein|nr:hypothetical protein [Dysgonamonadaceae bacterium]
MKTINLRGITNPLSEEELKKVKGGMDQPKVMPDNQEVDGGGGGSSCDTLPACGSTSEVQYCANKKCSDSCTANGRNGRCIAWPNGANYYCKICWLG